VHIGEPSLFRLCELIKIDASLIMLLFKPFVKFDITYSPPLPGDIRVLLDMVHHATRVEVHRPTGSRWRHGVPTRTRWHARRQLSMKPPQQGPWRRRQPVRGPLRRWRRRRRQRGERTRRTPWRRARHGARWRSRPRSRVRGSGGRP
jgi:hypothetical protein